jgi:hypothetical protein
MKVMLHLGMSNVVAEQERTAVLKKTNGPPVDRPFVFNYNPKEFFN